jgi:anti-sigma factor RsiW
MSAEEQYLDELLGAYALDAVTEEERRAVEEYLQVNPRARQEVREHREVATMLAWTGMRAPDGLWDRIASQLDESATAPVPTGELAQVLSLDSAREAAAVRAGQSQRRWVRSAAAWIGASAAAALVAVLAVVAFTPERTERSALVSAVEQARADRDSKIAQLAAADGTVVGEVIVDQDGHGYLVADGLPALGSDRTYQLWGVIGEQVISLGVLGPTPEIELFSVDGPVTQLVVTNEVAGGVVSDGNPDGAFAGSLA